MIWTLEDLKEGGQCIGPYKQVHPSVVEANCAKRLGNGNDCIGSGQDALGENGLAPSGQH